MGGKLSSRWCCALACFALPACTLLFEVSDEGADEARFESTILIHNDDQDGTLYDVPLVLVLEPRATMDPKGRDLRFVDSNGAPLAHEVELDASSSKLSVWIRMDVLPPSAEPITMRYGGTDSSVPSSSVWDEGFVGVWHLAGEAKGDVFDFKDSTGLRNDARGIEGSSGFPVRTPAVIGAGQEFQGGSHINAANPLGLDITGPELTLEAWAHYPDLPGDVAEPDDYGLIAKGGYLDGYRLLVSSRARIVFQATGATFGVSTGDSVAPQGAWHYIVASYDGAQMTIYVDGGRGGAAKRLGSLDGSAQPLLMGRGEANRYDLIGTLDEVRVSKVVRSAEWIKQQFLSMRGDLLELGPETKR